MFLIIYGISFTLFLDFTDVLNIIDKNKKSIAQNNYTFINKAKASRRCLVI